VSTQGSQPPRRPSPPPGRQASVSAPEGAGHARARPARPRSDADGPSFLAMIGVVAVVVATVIIVFFVFGYVLGRIFL